MARYIPQILEQPVAAVRRASAETTSANHPNGVFNESIAANAIYKLLAVAQQKINNTNARFIDGLGITMTETMGNAPQAPQFGNS